MLQAPVPELSAIRGRTLLTAVILASIVPIAALDLAWPDLVAHDAPLADALAGLAWYLLVGAFLWAMCVRAGIRHHLRLGKIPPRRKLRTYVVLGLPLFLSAAAGIYLLYLPLSYVAPGLVTELILEFPPIIRWETSPTAVESNVIAMASNILNVLILVIVAPVIEEILFRGFLLNRWWGKYGLRKSVALSSIVFGICHVDIIGATVFAIVLALLFVQTGSLIGPIIAHMSNNAIVLLAIIIEGVVQGGYEGGSLSEFRSSWWIGALGVIGIPWLWWFYKRHLKLPGPSAPSGAP